MIRATLIATAGLGVAALFGSAPVDAATAQRTLSATYLEARAESIDPTRSRLANAVELERAAPVAPATDSDFRVAVLQEIERPVRWVVLEWAAAPAELSARQARAAPALRQLEAGLVAPPDRRLNDDFGEADSASRDDAPIPTGAVFAVIHLDIGSPDQTVPQAALRPFIDAARASAGNLRAEAWRQRGHPNHYAIVLLWSSRASRDLFADGAAAHGFRSRIAALLGSPYDERLYRSRN